MIAIQQQQVLVLEVQKIFEVEECMQRFKNITVYNMVECNSKRVLERIEYHNSHAVELLQKFYIVIC